MMIDFLKIVLFNIDKNEKKNNFLRDTENGYLYQAYIDQNFVRPTLVHRSPRHDYRKEVPKESGYVRRLALYCKTRFSSLSNHLLYHLLPEQKNHE